MAEPKQYDVVIIGAGMAGLTAAIYARRANKTALILESKIHGGQIITTFNVQNWPGTPGISGVDLMNEIYHQANNLGAEIEYETVEKVEQIQTSEGAGANIKITTDEHVYLAKAVIIATGSADKPLGLPKEESLHGRGVSYCATCDGALYKGKTVAVVGGGNTAFYDALYLADICQKVYLVHRRAEFRAEAALVDKVQAKANVEFVLESKPVEILGDKGVSGLIVENLSGARRELAVDGIFIAVGRVPATDFCRDAVKLDASGYVVAGEDCHASAPGFYAVGDCRTKAIRQLVTAAGDGAVAATEAVRNLR